MPLRFLLKDYLLIWLVLVVIGVLCRPLTPVDETRAATVAWEMWRDGNFLVPHLNGEAYSHKPPLLQWCIHLSWLLFGVNDWSLRLVAPLFALGNLLLTAKLARRLWPVDDTSARLAPLILLATPVWALWTSLTLYDMLVTFFTLVGLHGIVRAAKSEALVGWGIAALGVAGGVLSKGPAILIMILPTALFAPWWLAPKPRRGAWYGGLLGAVLVGALLALAWAIPAGFAGGEEYRKAIFWGQSAGRISNSFAHKLPFWWYFALLPVVWLPWTAWPPLWRSLKSGGLDAGLRFCAIQSVFVLVVFSLISGKRIHYLLPTFPVVALFLARSLSLARPALTRRDMLPIGLVLTLAGLALLLLPLLEPNANSSELAEIALQTPIAAKLVLLGLGLGVVMWPVRDMLAGVRTLTVALLLAMTTAHLAYRQAAWQYFSMQGFADRLSAVQAQGAPIAHWMEYHGDFNFLGRLQQPLVEINTVQELLDWMKAHPTGYVVLVRQPNPEVSEEGAEFAQFYRGGRRVMLWKCTELLNRPGILPKVLLN
jgi:4-amino-4-deoxy-L-arabinose transferase-like glycosyltransferase